MGLTHSPKVVTKDLGFCFDIANKRSNLGDGTIKDLSRGKKTISPQNSPTITSRGSRSTIDLDGTNDYIDIGNSFDFANTDDMTFIINYSMTSDVSHYLLNVYHPDDAGAPATQRSLYNNYFTIQRTKRRSSSLLYIYSRLDLYDQNSTLNLIGHNISASAVIKVDGSNNFFVYSGGRNNPPIIYLNGTELEIDSETVDNVNNSGYGPVWSLPEVVSSSYEANIGYYPRSNAYSPVSINNVMLFERAMPLQEIEEHYRVSKGRFK